MRVLILNTYDIVGGAARAAYRLHKGLLHTGIDSTLLVANKNTDDYTVLGPRSKFEKGLNSGRSFLDSSMLSLYRKRDRTGFFSPGFVSNGVIHTSGTSPDIVHLHWICGGFVGVGSLNRFRSPLVWTLHDSWAFTGGCHVPLACPRYMDSCGRCPMLGSQSDNDLSHFMWKRKRKTLRNLDLTVVTPSRWLAECAAKSSLLKHARIEVIPNGLDLERYRPLKKKEARDLLSLPQDRKLILFGAMQGTAIKNKGFDLLVSALQKLGQTAGHGPYDLVVFGASAPASPLELGFKTHYLGMLHDDVTLALMYSAADVLVVPSRQENLPNTILEASACGTPAVAFRTGGIPDLIAHQQTGYLANPYDTSDLARGIQFILENSERWNSLSAAARQKTETEFSLEMSANRYVNLYQDIVKRTEARMRVNQ